MLTIDKVNEALADRARRKRGDESAFIAVGAALVLGMIATILAYRAAAGAALDLRDANRIARYLILAPAAVGGLLLLRSLHHRGQTRRDPRLRCPRCDRPFGDDADLVVATGNCPCCGHRALSDPPDSDMPTAPPPPPLGLEGETAAMRTIEKFNEELADLGRWRGRMLGKALLIGLAGGVACYAATSLFRPHIDTFFEGKPKDSVAITSLLGMYATFFTALCFLERSKDSRVRCQHCGAAIGEHARRVIATRRCPKCDRRVLAEPATITAGPPDDGPGSASRSNGGPSAT